MNVFSKRLLLPLGAGLAGAVFLTALYLGIVSLAETPAHALELFWEDKAFVIPIILGFGTQVGLYTFLKKGLYRPMHVPAGGATTAAGGGMSTVAMVACCAHHVADVLPLVGLTAAATFLANWKIPFMIVGLAMNLIGIVVMLRVIGKERVLTMRNTASTSMEVA
ncbi:MAG: hypothetical protein AB1791_01350 [Chloroflexota bacterium]